MGFGAFVTVAFAHATFDFKIIDETEHKNFFLVAMLLVTRAIVLVL